MKNNFEIRNRYFNINGRNIMNGYAIKFPIIKKRKEKEFMGYGISADSEKLDKLERDPMNKLKHHLGKININF